MDAISYHAAKSFTLPETVLKKSNFLVYETVVYAKEHRNLLLNLIDKAEELMGLSMSSV